MRLAFIMKEEVVAFAFEVGMVEADENPREWRKRMCECVVTWQACTTLHLFIDGLTRKTG